MNQPQTATTIPITVAYKIIKAQILITLLMATIGFIWWGLKAGYSAVLGGSVTVIGTLCLVLIMFNRHAKEVKHMLLAFYLGEATKMVVIVVLLALAFVYIDLNAGFFMTSFILTLLVNWLGFFIK